MRKAWPLKVRRVEGHSMVPRLLPGNVIVITHWFRPAKEGDVVVIFHEGKEKIKRVTQVDGKRVFLAGDNRMQSTDSRDFGWLEDSAITAKLLWPRA